MSIEANESFSTDHNWPFIRAVVPLQKPVVTAIVMRTFFTIILVMVTFLKLLLSSFIWDSVNKACFSKFLMGCYHLKPSTALLIFFFLCDFVQRFLLCLFSLWCLWISWMRRQDVVVLLFPYAILSVNRQNSSFTCVSFTHKFTVAIWISSCFNN